MLLQLLVLFICQNGVLGLTCSDITSVYQNSGCCVSGGETCMREIPNCVNVSNGRVCYDGTDIIVKGLLDAFTFSDTHITLNRHLKFTSTDTFDIGSAESKVRDLYVSDASIWIGDDHKIDIEGGKMKFRKRKRDKIPDILDGITMPQNYIDHPETILPHQWLDMLRQTSPDASMQDVYSENDYNVDVMDLLNVRSVNGVPSLEINGHIVFSNDLVYDIGDINNMIRNVYSGSGIYIIGDNPLNLNHSDENEYTDSGARCIINGEDKSSEVHVSGSVVNMQNCGEYIINYDCENLPQVSRIVNINNCPP